MSDQKAPRVSVVIPTYNCAPYLGGAIRSALDQCYENLEIIVVDDCSSDNTRDVVKDIAGIVYLRNDRNRGPGFTRNRGIEAATGDYVAFLDADDEWLAGKIAEQIRLLETDPSIVAVGGAMISWDAVHVPKGGASNLRWVSLEDLLVKNWLKLPTTVVRRGVLRRVGSFREDMVISEDFDLWLRLAEAGPLVHIEKPMARFRARPDGLSAGNRHLTYRHDREYMTSLLKRFRGDKRLKRLVRRGISARALERAIEQSDVEREYAGALIRTIESLLYWPRGDPSIQGNMFLRLRRTRRILIDWAKMHFPARSLRGGSLTGSKPVPR